MMRFLRGVKVVDLKRSILDRGKSDPEHGIYVFKEKRYVTYRDDSARPPVKLKWIRNAPYEISGALADGWEFVTIADPYFPEGAILNSEHKWQFKDMVWMKLHLEAYLDARQEAVDRSNRAAKSRQDKFDQHVIRTGGRPFTQEEKNKLVSETAVEIEKK